MITREYLDSFGIHELRKMGREYGVKSPASKRKEDLIEDILAISSGAKQAYRTNMGRKPKAMGVNNSGIIFADHTLVNVAYCNIEAEKPNGFVFNSNDYLGETTKFYGVARVIDGAVVVVNYLDENCSYIVLPNASGKIEQGDLIKGTIQNIGGKVVVNNYDVVSFLQNKPSDFGIEFVNYNEDDEIIDLLKNDQSTKFMFEVEADATLKHRLTGKQLYYFSTPECSDVAYSLNMMLDCQNLIKRLTETNEPFTLYIKDIEYMFGMLCAYFFAKFDNANQYINAGQIFKVIFSLIKSSKNAKVIILEKQNTKLNTYLDIILQRYCKK